MNLRYVDAHCHLQFPEYDADREELSARLAREGIGGIVVGVDRASSEAAVALAEQHEHLFASVGLHPNHHGEVFDEPTYRALAAHPKVVAVGECGLDYFHTDNVAAARGAQMPQFRAQALLAGALKKPLIMHTRPSKGTMDAYRDAIAALREVKGAYPALRGDVHFFVGGEEEAKELATLGFTISFTGVVTFARDYDAVVRSVPLHHILVETDAPYVAPVSRRGKRNDPLAIPEIVTQLALIRGEDEEVVRAALLANTVRLFGLDGGTF